MDSQAIMNRWEMEKIALRILRHSSRRLLIGEGNIEILQKKAGIVESRTGIPKAEYLEFALEMLEEVLGLDLFFHGEPREERELLSEKRQGEIALLLVIYRQGTNMLDLRELKRKLGNLAKDVDLERSVLEDFARAIMPEVLETALRG